MVQIKQFFEKEKITGIALLMQYTTSFFPKVKMDKSILFFLVTLGINGEFCTYFTILTVAVLILSFSVIVECTRFL